MEKRKGAKKKEGLFFSKFISQSDKPDRLLATTREEVELLQINAILWGGEGFPFVFSHKSFCFLSSSLD